jgi:diaminohydroxyphosphoribosylaminopyrimidine deaminase/5-amino-6-(5-phosphoribosylamino)uracil reductase
MTGLIEPDLRPASEGTSDHSRLMAAALALGDRGRGTTWPNPSVGALVVRFEDGRPVVVGRGWTRPGGRPHAETEALARAGSAARGATAYVTLEPCAHHGRTPPCAGALVAAGVGRVVSALTDPDPRVSGRGHAALRAAGIAVTEGVRAAGARALQAGFLSRVTRGRPILTLKLALSLDGRIATASGESRWITGPAARAQVHGLRATHDAVLVGGGTARADDPALTVRGFGPVRQPVRIVASRGLGLPRDGQLARTAREVPLWLAHAEGAPGAAAWEALGARLFPLPEAAGGIDPAALLAATGQAGLTRVLCEGGGSLAASLLRAGLVDEIVTFTAGVALGAEGRPGLGPLRLDRLADAPRFRLVALDRAGPDLVARWQP